MCMSEQTLQSLADKSINGLAHKTTLSIGSGKRRLVFVASHVALRRPFVERFCLVLQMKP